MNKPRPQVVLVENFLNPNLEVILNPRHGYRARVNGKPIRRRAGALQLIINEQYSYLYSYWQVLARYERRSGILTILDPAKVYRSQTTQRHYGYLLTAINRFGAIRATVDKVDLLP